jgi:hypothetical protein
MGFEQIPINKMEAKAREPLQHAEALLPQEKTRPQGKIDLRSSVAY